MTLADRIANELIVDQIGREFPDDGILAEESEAPRRRLGNAVWMIDLFDGTNGFISGNGDSPNKWPGGGCQASFGLSSNH